MLKAKIKPTTLFLSVLGIFVFLVLARLTYENFQRDKRFASLPASEHLAIAKQLLSANQADEAVRHLQAIPASAPEAEEGVKLLVDARTLKLQEEAAENARRQQLAQEQKDGDSSLSSYWPTTVRVQTDMNSFWLDQEERTCMSNPDEHGRIALIHCGGSERSDVHNIPVTFWGSVDRGKSSDWKCRRESEKFCLSSDGLASGA